MTMITPDGAEPGAPDPELAERAKRRRFSGEYKLAVLREADGCSEPGAIGALVRREGLYSSHLAAWRKQREQGTLAGLSRQRGRSKADPRDQQIVALRRRAERAEAELAKTRRVVEVQGKTSPRFWGSCSSPGAPTRAPSDDRAGRRRAHAGDRDAPGVPGAGCVARDDLPPPPTTARAATVATAAGAREGAV